MGRGNAMGDGGQGVRQSRACASHRPRALPLRSEIAARNFVTMALSLDRSRPEAAPRGQSATGRYWPGSGLADSRALERKAAVPNLTGCGKSLKRTRPTQFFKLQSRSLSNSIAT